MSSATAPVQCRSRGGIALHRPEGDAGAGASSSAPASALRARRRALAAYVGAALAALGIAGVVFKVWQADLKVPFNYLGDGVLYLSLVKGVLDNGWYLHNNYLGMPAGLDMHDFPLADSGHFLIIKLLLMVYPDPAVAFNGFVLLTFPLTAMTALFVLRSFGVSWAPALTTSLLYTCLPFHFFRGPHHIFLAAYYLAPLSLWVALRIFPGDWSRARPEGRRGPIRVGEWTLAAAVCAITGTAGIYYAMFACFFILVAGVAALAAYRRRAALAYAAVLVAVTGISVVLTLAPTFAYRWRHGTNRQAVLRSRIEGELYGLKVTQMLLPISGHRLPWLAHKKAVYNRSAPLVNENDHAALGLVGACGFLWLVGSFLFRRRAPQSATVEDGLGLCNLSAVLLATIGGFGSLGGVVLALWIRAYNRICVFIGFLALFAVALLLDRAMKRWAVGRRARAAGVITAGLLLALGLLDQTTPTMAPKHKELAQEFHADEAFVRRIEAALPPGAMVFQYPYVEYVEHPPLAQMVPYDMLRPYLHSRTLRWSYGAMRGRECAAWQKAVSGLPAAEMVRHVVQAGFGGLYVDRAALADRGARLEAELTGLLKIQPLVSDNARFVVFDLSRPAGGPPSARAETPGDPAPRG